MSKQPRPQKVIKMGTGSQARVAQACDRCRSKKIRCDGKQPRCTSCASIGFECKTSDKLSRRAFPRGYTESLEQRVIALEASIHESEALIQAKDAEIEALKSSPVVVASSSSSSPPLPSSSAAHIGGAVAGSCEEAFSFTGADGVDTIQQRPALLLPTENAPFQGPSSTKSLIYTFKARLTAQHGSCNLSAEALLAQEWELSPPSMPADTNDPSIAVSDELFRTWFTEWAPLLPVLHQPTSENAYMLYCKDSSTFASADLLYIRTQLNLIYAIVTIVSKSNTTSNTNNLITSRHPSDFEFVFKDALVSLNTSLPSLQCSILAQIYYILKGEYVAALRHRSRGVSICHSMGLHQCQALFGLNSLETEMRKRAFWCQYIIDKIAAAIIGVPVLLRDEDIACELPTEVDHDGQITENGILPREFPTTTTTTTPGNGNQLPDRQRFSGTGSHSSPMQQSREQDLPSSPITAAIKVIEVASILGKTLHALYSASVGTDVKISTMHTLVNQLDAWESKLPECLRPGPVGETQGAFATLLSIIYHYLRCLIRRPVICFGDGQAQETASSSIIQSVESSKAILRTLQYMDRKRMNLSICINRRELVLMASVTILWQWKVNSSGLPAESKLARNSERAVVESVQLLKTEPRCVIEEMELLIRFLTGRGLSEGMSGMSSACSGRSKSATIPALTGGQMQATYPPAPVVGFTGDLQQSPHNMDFCYNYQRQTSRDGSSQQDGYRMMSQSMPLPLSQQQQQHQTQTPSYPFRFGQLPPTSTSAITTISNQSGARPQEHRQPYIPHTSNTHAYSPALSHDSTNHGQHDGRMGSSLGARTAQSITSSTADEEGVGVGVEGEGEGEDGKQWRTLLSKIDSGRSNIFNGIYGGSEAGPADFEPELKGMFN